MYSEIFGQILLTVEVKHTQTQIRTHTLTHTHTHETSKEHNTEVDCFICNKKRNPWLFKN